MDQFNFRKQSGNTLSLDLCGTVYTFDVSPTNYGYVKRMATLAREIDLMAKAIGELQTSDWKQIESAFDQLKGKEKDVLEAILPGAWEDLWPKAGEDLMNMVELIMFVAEKVKDAGAKAKIEAALPAGETGDDI